MTPYHWHYPATPSLVKRGSIVAIGNFDAVHEGHRRLLQVMHDVKKIADLPTAVLTFDPNPKAFFAGVQPLMSLEEKRNTLLALGIDEVLVLAFNANTAHISAKDFVDDIMIKALNCQHWIMGKDCRFGYKRIGCWDFLSRRDDPFILHMVETIRNEKGEKISSTALRQAHLQGQNKQAQGQTLITT